MLLDKFELRKLAANGYVYSGWWEGQYHWVRTNSPGKYEHLRCRQIDIEDGSCQFLMENDISRAKQDRDAY